MEVNFVRLILEPSFEFPVTITLNLDTNEFIVESLSIIQSRGYEQGDSRIKVTVDEQFVIRVREEIDALFLEPSQVPARFGVDGTTWRLEIQWHGHRHRREQWCPDSGALYDIGTLLLDKAGKYVRLGSLC
ncbi:hypothetical protein SAMN04487965_0404 [Microbulbifer donghaiensis]|uniref:Uncharacterized protein n=1 Tax=Microbulbifer donghaiensis TaxID=494016 RepID=A0A1M4VEJ6_9GAMM|nr:hypothetical protein [Microbulbifer donghaiensis]SHE67371.1 hypothetical protein SAMN04487965_0404 [Microbulbifer donghaiensis]